MYVRPEFDTQFERRGRSSVKAASGTPLVVNYRPTYDDRGVLHLVESGTHDLYAEIQSFSNSTDLATIINRYFNGDPYALSRVQGAYMDLTGMPSNVHEVYNMMSKAQEDFKTLPVEIQARFGNDAVRFLSTLGTPEWMDAMKIDQTAPVVAPRDIVKDAVDRASDIRESEV